MIFAAFTIGAGLWQTTSPRWLHIVLLPLNFTWLLQCNVILCSAPEASFDKLWTAGLQHSDNITDALASFHWLRAPERIKFKLAVVVYSSLYSTALQYLSDLLCNITDVSTRSWLRSSTSRLLDIRPSWPVTVGDRWFSTAGPRPWNSLPKDVQPASSLTVFRQQLKHCTFRWSY